MPKKDNSCLNIYILCEKKKEFDIYQIFFSKKILTKINSVHNINILLTKCNMMLVI